MLLGRVPLLGLEYSKRKRESQITKQRERERERERDGVANEKIEWNNRNARDVYRTDCELLP